MIYVDDIILATNCSDKLNEVKTKLTREFDMTDLGEPQKLLGLEIIRKYKIILLHQRTFINSLIKELNLENAKEVYISMVTSDAERKERITENENENFNRQNITYKKTIGRLLYASNALRPDITFAVNVLSRK